MSLDAMFGAMNISATGLAAERLRLEVIANNIANAFTTRTPEGGPYRRRELIFSALMSHLGGADSGATRPSFGGVQVIGIEPDPSELPRVYNPGHPDADAEGYVTMPNVQIPIEMVDLITANRAYEANLRVLQSVQRQAEQVLSLLR